MANDPQFESVLTDAMRAQVGVEGAPATHEVTTTGVRMFARAVGYSDPVFYDRDEARRRGYRDLPAPPAYLGTLVFNPATPDRTWGRPPGFSPRLDLPYKNTLNGGTDIEYFDEDICAGDVLTVRMKIEQISERYSQALGGAMVISVTATTYRNQHDRVAAIMRGTSIAYGS